MTKKRRSITFGKKIRRYTYRLYFYFILMFSNYRKMKTDSITLILLYAVTLVLVLLFRNDDIKLILVLGFASIIASILFEFNMALVVIATICFIVIENLCVYYGLWKYNTKLPAPFAPIWIYFAWYMSIIFIIKLQDILQRNKIIFYMPCNRV
jgi:hypothetical protein